MYSARFVSTIVIMANSLLYIFNVFPFSNVYCELRFYIGQFLTKSLGLLFDRKLHVSGTAKQNRKNKNDARTFGT